MQKPLNKNIFLVLAVILFRTDTSFMPTRPRSFSAPPCTASHLSENPHLITEDVLQKINAGAWASLPTRGISLRKQAPHSAPPSPDMPRTEPCQVVTDTHSISKLGFVSLSSRVQSSSSRQAPAVLQNDCLKIQSKKHYFIANSKINLKPDEEIMPWVVPHEICGYFMIIYFIQSPWGTQLMFEAIPKTLETRLIGINTAPTIINTPSTTFLYQNPHRLSLPNLTFKAARFLPTIGYCANQCLTCDVGLEMVDNLSGEQTFVYVSAFMGLPTNDPYVFNIETKHIISTSPDHDFFIDENLDYANVQSANHLPQITEPTEYFDLPPQPRFDVIAERLNKTCKQRKYVKYNYGTKTGLAIIITLDGHLVKRSIICNYELETILNKNQNYIPTMTTIDGTQVLMLLPEKVGIFPCYATRILP